MYPASSFNREALLKRADQRTADYNAAEDEYIGQLSAQDPGLAARMALNTSFNRARNMAATGPAGYNRNWVAFNEALQGLSEQTGKQVQVRAPGLSTSPAGTQTTKRYPASLAALMRM